MLDFWRDDLSLVARDDDITRTVSIKATHPGEISMPSVVVFLSSQIKKPVGLPVPINAVLGGIERDPFVEARVRGAKARNALFLFLFPPFVFHSIVLLSFSFDLDLHQYVVCWQHAQRQPDRASLE